MGLAGLGFFLFDADLLVDAPDRLLQLVIGCLGPTCVVARPAGLGFFPFDADLLVDAPDRLLKLVVGCLGPTCGVARLAGLCEAGRPGISTKSIQSTSIV